MVEAGKVGGGAGEPPKAAGGAPSVANAPKPSPLAAALREVEQSLESVANPGGPASEPEGEALARARRMRADLATRKASLLISGLMQTPDCALDLFREGRGVDPAIELRHLKQLRDVLDALHAVITANDPARWKEVESFWGLLGHDASRAADESVGEPLEVRPSPREPLPGLAEGPPTPAIAPGPLSTAPTVRGDLLSPWLRSPVVPGASATASTANPPAVASNPVALAPPAAPSIAVVPEPLAASKPPSAPAVASAPTGPVPARPPVAAKASVVASVPSAPNAPVPAKPPASLAPPTVPRAPGPPRPSVLDRTAEASYSTDDRTSLHAVPSRGEAALPFRSRPPAAAASSDPSLLGPDVPMDGGEGVDGETRRIRLHVLPFKPKPVPFEPTPAEDRTALHPTVGAGPRPQGSPLPFVPAQAPVGASPSGASTRSWEGEERTALLDCEPPPEEPTTRSEASLLMSTMEVETRRTPTAGVAAAPAASSAATSPARPSVQAGADPPTSLLDLEGYAAYRAEISLRPDDILQIRQRYKLHGAASYERLDAYWQNRLAGDPALRQTWQALCQRYAAWLLLKQKK